MRTRSKSRRATLVTLTVTAACAVAISATFFLLSPSEAVAQSGTKGGDGDDPKFSEQLWQYLKTSDYKQKWTRWPKDTEGFTEGDSPHGAFLKVYVNEFAAKKSDEFVVNSVIVKENYNKDKKLVAITPMIRVGKDYDPEHNDWYWAKYRPDGNLFVSDDMPIAGKVQGCIECHSSAKGDDYVFTNDK